MRYSTRKDFPIVPIILICLLFFVVSCDRGLDKSVTGNFTPLVPRDAISSDIPMESLIITPTPKKSAGFSDFALAGKYRDVEAVSVFRFNISRIVYQELLDAWVTFEVDQIFDETGDDNCTDKFELLNTKNDWADSTLITEEPVELDDWGEPAVNKPDTLNTWATLDFDVDPKILESWDEKGSFLLRSHGDGDVMAGIYSNDTIYPPVLTVVRRLSSGTIDTTDVNCSGTNYYINTGHDDAEPLISDGAQRGYVMTIDFPDAMPELAPTNRCILPMRMSRGIFAGDEFEIAIYPLTEEYTSIETAKYSTSDGKRPKIYPDTTLYNIDITNFVNNWRIGDTKNFGLLFTAYHSASSPDQCIFQPAGPIQITYSPRPENR